MAVNSALPPYPSFFDSTGAPLENGFIFIGQPGFEARTTPKASFFDIAQTIPSGTASGAAIRTRAGFPINQARAPSMIYVDGDFSMTVTDRNGVVLYTALNNTLALNVGGSVGPVLWGDGDLGAVGGGFANESSTGFVRPSAGVMQTAVTGALVAEASTSAFRMAVPLVRTISPTVTAGTDAQGQGLIAQDFNVVTTAAANPSGVTLPTTVAGRRVTVVNRGANLVNVYPATGAQIGALAVNLPWPVPVGTSLDFIARSATQWEVTADALGILPLGTNGTILASNGAALAYRDASVRITNSLNASTSVIANGIPAWAKRVTVAIQSASTNGTSPVIVQLGTAATILTSGYLGASTVLGATALTTANYTNGAVIDLGVGDTASAVRHGTITFVLEAADRWCFAGGVSSSATAHQCVLSGSANLSGTLTRLRITTVGGTDTFDLGTMTVVYE